ncbi:ABC transporter G family member 35-like [Cryptomeria japonica]|uniref:ABC transporter G family member 35-like n=1 Tax=Cryptomeria japonica TaxID=3369 RepID=UPI0027DA208E|nr:ABC transporter G family member 35-like [Cryptomeria japonica]
MEGLERVWESGRRISNNLSRNLSNSSGGSQRRRIDEDEEALRWAALEKLPTYDRLRTAIMQSVIQENDKTLHKEVDVRKLGFDERQIIIDRLFKVAEEDNEKFLRKLRARIDRVGIQLPTVEVRFENLRVDAECYVGGRALPTLWNSARNSVESLLDTFGLSHNKKANLTVLKDVSGILKPSRMTLLLGPPASGKTTLLLALAGKLDPSLKVKGNVTYNGHRLEEFVPRKTSAYISQHDLHVGEMTVRETIDFSARCQGVGDRYELLSEIVRREKEAGIFPEADMDLFMKATAMKGVESSLQTDYILKILGLDICGDTVVGNDMIRGISGGQKKRVTTGEMIAGPTKTLFMDEISTGLDSSTTFQIVKCLQQFTHLMDGTILMSLLQPAPETFDLFDDILLLSEGYIVYGGPRENVLEFFESCGFKCPERKGIADFLQEVTSKKDQEQYWIEKSRPYQYVPVKEFAFTFKQFHAGRLLENELAVPYEKNRSHKAALVFSKHCVPKLEIFKACFAKEWLLIKRNSFTYIFRIVQILVLSFIASTVYLRTEMHHKTHEGANMYLGALFFGLLINMFNGYAELALTIFRLPVFFKQRDLLFYPAWAFTLSTFILRIPISLLEAGIWVLITYYTIGFAPEASRFFRQYLLMFLVHQMASSLFSFIAGICRSMIISNTGGTVCLLLIFMLGGFVLPKDSIPKWWMWGYWCSPLTYAQNAITVNEMLAPRWQIVSLRSFAENTTNLGEAVMASRSIYPMGYWYWLGAAALLGFSLLFNVLSTFALAYLNPLGKPQAVIPKEVLNEMQDQENGTEQGLIMSRSLPRSLSSADGSGTFEKQVRRVNISSTSLKGNMESELETTTRVKRGMVLPFQPLTMSFEGVNYFVDMPPEMREQGVTEERLQLLRDVTGAFRPGVLTALMGVSGAGKTTLMDVLAGRKTGGHIEGDVRISGFPKKQETFARISGYCEQTDIHSPQVTVWETLIYSAFLRLPKDVEDETKTAFANEVMELVELENLRDALVGLPDVSGLSTEQRKRLTIAVELVANPSIIFMDEPTSGLDARAAAVVMRTVRNTVDTGRTVVCTIHQPSIDIFEAFDELLLMKRGGQIIYNGPLGHNSHKLVEYFEDIPNVPKIKDKYNPATWMLEASSFSSELRLGIDFAEHYRNSSLYKYNKELVTELSTPPPEAKDLYFPTQYSESFLGQFKSCLWKQWWTYWRSPEYNNVRYFFTLTCALFIGTIFWRIGRKRDNDTDLFIIAGALYGAVIFLGVTNCSTVQPVVAVERTVFYRERAAGMYSAMPYALAQVVIELPYILGQTVMYTIIVYSMVSFEWTIKKFSWFFFSNYMTFLYFTFYGMMTVSITPNHQVASIVAAIFYSIFSLFSGFFIPRPKIPKWWVWYYWICPVAWTLYGLIVPQYGDVTDQLQVNGEGFKPLNQFLEDYFGYKHDFLGAVAAVLVGFPVLFAFIFAYCIKVLNFQKR